MLWGNFHYPGKLLKPRAVHGDTHFCVSREDRAVISVPHELCILLIQAASSAHCTDLLKVNIKSVPPPWNSTNHDISDHPLIFFGEYLRGVILVLLKQSKQALLIL